MANNIPLLYEYEISRKHSENENTECFHWSNIPEDWLFESGYIHDFNKHRLKRLMTQKESVSGLNRLKDYGFDGMSKELINNQYIYNGLQAKYYKSKVTANDIGTFLATQMYLTRKNNLSKGYLYTYSNLQEDLSGYIADPDYPIRHIFHPWEEPKASLEPKEGKIDVNLIQEKDLPLRDYQKDALLQLEDKEGINALHIPCRMGKTLIAGHHIKNLNPKTIIIIAPLKVSVDNLQERLECFFPEYTTLLVDSDADGTTNLDEVKSFIEKEGFKIIYSTYKSAIDILNEVIEEYDDYFILVDEVHNANEELCNFILNFNEGLVMSATLPEEIEDILEINHTVYIPFSQGIKEGYITDYTLWLPYLVKNSDGSTNVDIDIPTEFSSFNKDLTAKALYLATVLLKTGSRKCIVYLKNQEECDLFNSIVNDIFKLYHGLEVWSGKIDANVSKGKRKEILKQFEEKDFTTFCILSSVRILDEAIDIPKCDSVFITTVGEKSSDIRMMQRSQRSSTLDSNNPSKRNNIILWAEGWEQCVESLNLLRESDPEFHKKVRIVDCNYDTNSNNKRIELVKSELIEFTKWNTMKCISLDEKWEMKRQEWIQFYEIHGRSPSHASKFLEEKKLGHWKHGQRKNYKKEKLSQERINILNLTPGWKWRDNKDEIWELKRQEFINFYKINERSPSSKSKDIEEKRIGCWQLSQRKNYKSGKKITPERINILNSTPGWKWKDDKDEIWELTRQEWVCFYELHKRSPCYTSKNIKEKNLSQWQSHQRLNKKTGKKITPERINILNLTPGWKWEDNKDEIWEKNRQEWIIFTTIKNKFPSNKSKDIVEKILGEWQSHQRRNKKTGKKITSERIDILNKTPGWKWEGKFEKK